MDITSPLFYFRCPDESFESWGITNASSKNFCLNGNEFVVDSGQSCDWKQIEYQLVLKNVLSANIPIGDESIRKIVLYGTIIASWIGCFCVVFTIYSKMRLINKKLS